jgi:hypothetical protein
MPQRRRRVESRDFAITEIDFSNEVSDPDDRFDHAQHFWASTVESRSCSARRRGVVSKRAMNQLLRSLEKLGYIVGSDGLDGGPARLVRLTRRGHVVYAKIHDILRDVESKWSAELGPERFAELKELLSLLWESLSAR